MSYKVSAGNVGPLSLNETDPVLSVLQNISIILKTRKGTVPAYRDFGLAQDFVDKPIPAAKVLLHAAVKDAVETYEPRAEVIGVTFEEDPNAPGKLVPTVEVNIINE